MSVMMLVAAMVVIVIVVVLMVGNLHVAAARHDEDVAFGAHHLDVGAVQR